MGHRELLEIIGAIIILTVAISLPFLIPLKADRISVALVASTLAIGSAVLGRKLMGAALDARVEHEIWRWSRYGFKPGWRFKQELPLGAIIPLIFSAFTLGFVKFPTLLTYETAILERRASKRFGHYSLTEMTDWHNAIIGSAGILSALLVAFITYWVPGLEMVSKTASYYAFWNLLPISKLDGAQIFFGSRVLWTALALISLVFFGAAIVL